MVVAVFCDCGKWLFRKGITAEEQANDGYRARNSWDSLPTGQGLLAPEGGVRMASLLTVLGSILA